MKKTYCHKCKEYVEVQYHSIDTQVNDDGQWEMIEFFDCVNCGELYQDDHNVFEAKKKNK